MITKIRPLFLAIACFSFSASIMTIASPAPLTEAIAIITPIGDSRARGVIEFSETKKGVKVHATFNGLTPGKHGFHIHEFGDISKPDGSGAGGHFNPDKSNHGGPHTTDRHCGDLGNVIANEEGVAVLDYVDTHISLHGRRSIVGRGVIIHEKEDDFSTQPTGASGGRIGQGTIGLSKAH